MDQDPLSERQGKKEDPWVPAESPKSCSQPGLLDCLTNRNDKRPDGNFRQGFAGAYAAVQESKNKKQVSLPAP